MIWFNCLIQILFRLDWIWFKIFVIHPVFWTNFQQLFQVLEPSFLSSESPLLWACNQRALSTVKCYEFWWVQSPLQCHPSSLKPVGQLCIGPVWPKVARLDGQFWFLPQWDVRIPPSSWHRSSLSSCIWNAYPLLFGQVSSGVCMVVVR
jgi:hypothetical protein